MGYYSLPLSEFVGVQNYMHHHPMLYHLDTETIEAINRPKKGAHEVKSPTSFAADSRPDNPYEHSCKWSSTPLLHGLVIYNYKETMSKVWTF